MGKPSLSIRAAEAPLGRAEKQFAATRFFRSALRTCVMQRSSGFVIKCLAVVLIGLVHQPSTVRAVTNGYITALLSSECTSVPPPPPLGQIATGPDYVIMTVADADPRDYATAQQLVTDAVFEFLMPRYCALSGSSGVGCVTNRVQWNLVTYDAGGNPTISGGPATGAGFHYCGVVHGYVTAVIRGDSGVLPPAPPVGVIAVGSDSVMMTIADGDPLDLGAAQQLATDAIFTSLMRTYCALPRGTGPGYVSGQAQWQVMTYDTNGNAKGSACAASGCGFHSCVVSNGYITALLRSDCASAPPPPPLGQIATGSNYVIMTVADADPRDFATAQQLVTDSVFESLMPMYCALDRTTNNCVTNRVQWAVETYDAGGNATISGCAASGCAAHYCSETNQSSPTLIINSAAAGRITLSWMPRTAGWVLQETLNYPAGPWSNSPTAG